MTNSKLILWISLAILFLVLLNLPQALSDRLKSSVREALVPLQGALTGTTRAMRDSVAAVRGLGDLHEENQRVTAELIRLQAEVRSLKDLETENENLRVQLTFSQRDRRHLIPCQVVGRDSEGWWQTLRLNKGLADGIATNLAVVSVEGLVGRIVGVSEHSSDVLLISDPACKVSAQILRTGSFGIVSGRGPSWKGQVVSRMDFINKNTPILAGDEVVSSGLGGIFPKGLLIGYIDKVYVDRWSLYQYADVITRADLGELQYVFAVKDTPIESLYKDVEPLGEGPS